MTNEVLESLDDGLKKAIDAFNRELAKLRTGRANPALLEGIRVDYYGTATPINQMASVSVPENRLIVIVPWDQGQVGAIEKAIQKSTLGISPASDGKVIRIAFPPLTEDRRRDIVKQLKKLAEECKIQVRMERRDAIETLKSFEKDGDIAEDDSRRAQEKVQKAHDDYIRKVDEITERKEKEVMEI
ncbi:MAG: ribosome recycling factor [Deltaproteobacteria bacterium]|nr:ribosome recycling factor [Deltaproteobacteria bacterium]